VPGQFTVALAAIAAATPRSRLITLDLTGVPFTFLPGQAVTIGQHGQDIRRPYSIACSPEQASNRRALELLVGVDATGSPGPHLPSTEPGALIDLEGPLGSFVYPEGVPQPRLLFVGGGTGIAPLRAMADHAMRKHPDKRMALLYSARRADEFAFIEELREHARAGRIELHQTVTREDEEWQGRRGRIGRAHFEAVLHEPAETLCFVCGPASMVSEAVATLEDLGVATESIRTEQWGVRI
jgi:CDP-4-dehydro-6-deoxyglucose reductase/3-phenylpropionate/trans-cinnamate dioxygenase ferredoxin reductase subunit